VTLTVSETTSAADAPELDEQAPEAAAEAAVVVESPAAEAPGDQPSGADADATGTADETGTADAAADEPAADESAADESSL